MRRSLVKFSGPQPTAWSHFDFDQMRVSDKSLKVVMDGQNITSAVMDWQNITFAPFDRDLELAVIDGDGPHALVFPCRRDNRGWVKSGTDRLVEVHPTHWREWKN
jgi:hypothetical protein